MADELNPAEEARLRRLLARSRHDETVPDDVAARLDDVLARLEADDPIDEPLADVHELAARRRRKVTSLLVAAAAVVVLGVGLGQVVGTPGSESDSLTAADSASEEVADSTQGRMDGDQSVTGGGVAGSLDDGAATEEKAESFSSLDSGAALGYDGGAAWAALGDLLVVRGRLAPVSAEDFSRSAARLQRQAAVPVPTSARGDERQSVPLSRAVPRVQRLWRACAPTDVGEGTGIAVLYEGGPAILVLRPVMGDTQVVELLQCGTGSPLRTVTLPAR